MNISVGRFPLRKDERYASISLRHHHQTKKKYLYTYIGAGFITEIGAKFNKIGLLVPAGIEIVEARKRFSLFSEVIPFLFYESKFNRFIIPGESSITPNLAINFGIRFIIHK